MSVAIERPRDAYTSEGTTPKGGLSMLFQSTLPQRFWNKVYSIESGCWMWCGAITGGGYGNFNIQPGQWSSAHRLTYQEFVGLIPISRLNERWTLDHLCRVRACVNPLHLEVVTNRENILRGVGFAARHAKTDSCVNGHEFTPENTAQRTRPEGGRLCRECRRWRNAHVTVKRRAGLLKPARSGKGGWQAR
ncbi:hypothetical protein LCGC14_2286080 [marine sediment metagenome]|uniref:HNH nuclease domain-containing protein n=1 Tax=marine sediment metagenome TaxID=412755 RepID=A0A0F9CT41_9ZZZZ